MPRETVVLELDPASGCYEAAALLLATLAYPLDLKRRHRFRDAMCRDIIAAVRADDPTGARGWLINPAYMDAPRTLKRDADTLNRMLLARDLVAPWIYHDGPGRPENHAGPGKRLTLNGAVDLMSERYGIDPANVKNRIWARAKPVVHAICALDDVQEKLTPVGFGHWAHIFCEPEIIGAIVTRAEFIRTNLLPELPSVADFEIPEAQTIRFALTG